MKRGLLVDYGGVLTSSVLESFAAFCETEGIEIDVFREVVLGAARTPDSPFARIETGEIEQHEFDAIVAALLSDACGRTIASEGLKQRLFAAVRADEAMRTAVRAARTAGVRTGLLSNSWGGRDYPWEELDGLFDAVVVSGDVGMRKPNADIFLHAAKAIGLEPDDCVFVDDFRVNVEGAESAGMTGVLHRDAGETIARLEELLGMPLGQG